MAVVGMQITNRSTFAKGRRFGSVGVYERIDGMLQFAVSPGHPRNAGIIDLDLAPRDGAGHVRFQAGFTLLQPVDAGRSSGRLLVCCPNRGGRALSYHRASGAARPGEGIDPGDGLLMHRGWGIAWVGWQWDVPAGRDAV
ncbi:MAG: hypothetical protein HYU75_01505, partial [Betaproteobacteria bacterium]|nr:hypothetical protein [Betaproteobacteria bacterium]